MAVPGSPEPGSRRIIDMAPIRVETESTTRFRTTKNRKNPQDQKCPIWGRRRRGIFKKNGTFVVKIGSISQCLKNYKLTLFNL